MGKFHMATATQAAETGFNESIATLYARYKALCTTYSTLIKGSYVSDFTTKMQALDAARDSLFGSIRNPAGAAFLCPYRGRSLHERRICTV